MAMTTNKTESLPTQQFIDIESIDNGTVKLKGGALRKIILVSGTNFALKSTEEQEMIIFTFQGFLNAIDFPLQFFVHSRKPNVDDYLKRLNDREMQEPNDLLKNQITEYREFIRLFVSENAIMQKQFFVTIPFDQIRLTQSGVGIVEKIIGFFKTGTAKSNSTGILAQEAMEQINQRVAQVVAGLGQVGLRAVPLDTEELLELFYNLYNPSTIEKRTVQQ
ncbi:MAG: hypothetical protein Q8R26_01430 [bacterium]|nr:hypothetical protein [bacterium]